MAPVGEGARRRLTAHGTLYKALSRLEQAGLVTSRWEDAGAGTAEGRPRRRLYRITTAGRAAYTEAVAATVGAPRLDPA